MAQPPLSRAIRRLERRLGAQLFERSSRCATLTVAGLTLFDEAGRWMRYPAMTTPTLVITAKPGVATDLLRRIVEAYTAPPDAPRVEIAVS